MVTRLRISLGDRSHVSGNQFGIVINAVDASIGSQYVVPGSVYIQHDRRLKIVRQRRAIRIRPVNPSVALPDQLRFVIGGNPICNLVCSPF